MKNGLKIKHLKIITLIIVIQLLPSNIFAGIFPSFNYSKGPLLGKNTYAPFLIYFNNMNEPAQSGKRHDFEMRLATYYTQDFAASYVDFYHYLEYGRYYNTNHVLRDYESCMNEVTITYNPIDNLTIGTNIRLITYYGGFLDFFIEGFHHAFGFPGGARDFFITNRVFVNIVNDNGVRLALNKDAVSFGDIDLWTRYTFLDIKHIKLAGFFAFKIPTGDPAKLSGSGYPDISFAVLCDLINLSLFSFYFNAGIVIPFDSFISTAKSRPYPMFNGLIAIEIHPTKHFSLIGQLIIKSLPFKAYLPFSWDIEINYYDLPQINLLVGFKVAFKGHTWQFYFEEDTFTNQGADIVFNLTYGYKFNTRGF